MSDILIPGAIPTPDQQPARNGEVTKPSLWIEYDPETQSVQMHVNPDKIKTWDFARAVLLMGVQASERMAEIQMARAAQQAMQNTALADQVMRDLPRRKR